MYIQRNTSKRKSGKVYNSVLLCHKYRENGKIKTKVLANLSMLPPKAVLSLENSLKAKKGRATIMEDEIIVEKIIDYGYFFILKSLMDRLRISELFEKLMPNYSSIAKLLIIGKIMTKGSKLSILNWIKRNPFFAKILGVDIAHLKIDEIYKVVGSMFAHQEKIEQKWAVYNKIKTKEIFLYDITSSYFEGTQNQLAAFGYSRDGKKDKMQITIGLITDQDGFPLKIEVFKGNMNDYKTVEAQLKDLKKTFGAERIIFVGDRGMKIRYNLDKMSELDREGIDYITGLTKEEIKGLVKKDVFQLSLFSDDLAEVSDGDVRYVLSKNPILAEKKQQTRNQQRNKFELGIIEVKSAWKKRKNQNQSNIEKIKNGNKNKKLITKFSIEQIDTYKKRVVLLTRKYRMNKYYSTTINADEFKIDFSVEEYNKDIELDGIYVVATTVKKERLDTEQVRKHYKKLQNVEHAFRDLKTNRINIRPIYHVNEATTRGHVLISMFSFAIIHQIEQGFFPLVKKINKQEKEQFSYKDLEDEVKEIKIVEFNIGKGNKKIQITELSEHQKMIFQALKIKENELTKIAS